MGINTEADPCFTAFTKAFCRALVKAGWTHPATPSQEGAVVSLWGEINLGWGYLTLVTLQIINYPGCVAIAWKDGVVDSLDHTIIGDQSNSL